MEKITFTFRVHFSYTFLLHVLFGYFEMSRVEAYIEIISHVIHVSLS